MKLACLMLGLLLASAVVLVVLAVAPLPWPDSLGAWAMLFVMATYGSGSLLGIWGVLGGRATPWRLVGVIALATACICLDKMGGSELGVDGWGIAVMLQMVATALPLFVVRAAGIAMEDIWRRGSAHPATEPLRRQGLRATDASPPQRIQWSVLSMLSCTAALCVSLSCLSTLAALVPSRLLDDLLSSESVAFVAVFVAVPPFVLWATLGSRWLAARIVLLGLSILATALALTFGPTDMDHSELDLILITVLAPALWLTGVLLVVRLAGYRLVWRRRLVL